MIVTKETFQQVLSQLKSRPILASDTETTSLLMFKDGKVFAVIIAESKESAYYFNFNPLEPDALLGEEEVVGLTELFKDESKTWYFHNAMFDCLMLKETFDIDVTGDVFCTMAQGRVEYNEHMNYSLEASLKRIGGEQKDDRVKQYIKEHGLITKIPLDDKKEVYECHHYDKVPFPLIVEYALTDARSTFALGERLSTSIESKSQGGNGQSKVLADVKANEMALHHAIVRSTRRGILLDRPYIERAISYERERLHGALREFKALSGVIYSNHFKTLERVFEDKRELFTFGDRTKTGQVNPTFDETVLRSFDSPLSASVLLARDSQGKLNFYNSYLFYADKNDVLHPNMISGGTNTGRMSSKEPNMQNITSEDLMSCKGCGKGYEHITVKCEKCGGETFDAPEFLVRRSFIPRPDYVFFNPDYSSQEYRLMLDMAKMLYDAYRERSFLPPVEPEYYELLRKIKEEGYDVHAATSEEVGGISRSVAKTVNFLKLYGGGSAKLAGELGIPLHEAQEISDKYFKAMPYVKFFINTATKAAQTKGFVKNWLGRQNSMPRDFAYKAPNQLIQGGCADVMKVAMVRIDEMLKNTKSHQLLAIHDEDILEVHYSDIDTVPQRTIEIMEAAYPYNYLPLTASAEWSEISLADKRKGFPTWTNNQRLRA
jgi:DNA polymerase-1